MRQGNLYRVKQGADYWSQEHNDVMYGAGAPFSLFQSTLDLGAIVWLSFSLCFSLSLSLSTLNPMPSALNVVMNGAGINPRPFALRPKS